MEGNISVCCTSGERGNCGGGAGEGYRMGQQGMELRWDR